jgi:hypothetical protein
MKHIVPVFALIVGIAVLVLAVVPAAQLAHARYSRMQEAEQIAAKLYIKIAMMDVACSETTFAAMYAICKPATITGYSELDHIRKAAASGDDLLWNRTVKLANDTATNSDRILKALEKIQQAQKRPR